MGIYLGDLTIEQIENRLGIKFSAEDKEILHYNYQAKINKVPLKHGKWHCYDLPFMFMTHDKETALSYAHMFEKYNPKTFKQCLQIGYEDKEQEHE